MAPPRDRSRHPDVLEINGLRATVLRAGRLLLEAVVVPTVLAGHSAARHRYDAKHFGGGRLVPAGDHLPVVRGPPAARHAAARLGRARGQGRDRAGLRQHPDLPAAAGARLGGDGTAVPGQRRVRPADHMRLARDFVHVPAHILDKRGVRRMFTEVAVIWGFSRIIDVALNLGFLHRGVDAGLWARGLLSPLLTVFAVVVCTAWGWRSLRRNGISLSVCAGSAPIRG